MGKKSVSIELRSEKSLCKLRGKNSLKYSFSVIFTYLRRCVRIKVTNLLKFKSESDSLKPGATLIFLKNMGISVRED